MYTAVILYAGWCHC